MNFSFKKKNQILSRAGVGVGLGFINVIYTYKSRHNPPGIKIDILAKRCVMCHLKAWTRGVDN